MPKVLLVDDSDTIRESIQLTLEDAGYEVSETGDPGKAARLAAEFLPDAMICDIEMPEMNGLEVLRTMRAQSPTLPILMLTSKAEVESVVESMRLGACGYVVKGTAERILLEEVRAAIEQGQIRDRNRRLEDANRAYKEGLEQIIEQKTFEIVKLEQARAQAEKLAALTTLVAGAAHEINNPLAVMLSNLEWIEGVVEATVSAARRVLAAGEARTTPMAFESPATGDEVVSVLRDTRSSGERIAYIVSSLRRLAHPAVTGEFCNLGEVMKGVALFSREQLAGKAELVCNIAPPSAMVGIREEAMISVMSNLVVNAAHAVTPGKGLIDVRARIEGSRVIVEVRDNGRGIPKDVLPRVLEPFFTTKEVGEGTGLGLSLVDRIVQSVGGSIEIESEVGQGTLIRLRLPLPLPKEANASPVGSAA